MEDVVYGKEKVQFRADYREVTLSGSIGIEG